MRVERVTLSADDWQHVRRVLRRRLSRSDAAFRVSRKRADGGELWGYVRPMSVYAEAAAIGDMWRLVTERCWWRRSGLSWDGLQRLRHGAVGVYPDGWWDEGLTAPEMERCDVWYDGEFLAA
jgi:hypothetical protein